MRIAVFLGTCILAMGTLVFAGQAVTTDTCRAPKYKIADTHAQTSQLEAIAISIKPMDVTVRNLFALACKLRVDYPTQVEVEASIFNDEKAAKNTPVYGIENPKGSNEAAYLARYYLNRQKGIETLTLTVDPDYPCGRDIQVDLKQNKVSIFSCK
jgi:hypothetical protein